MGSIAFRVDRHESTLDILKRHALTWNVAPDVHPEIVGSATGSGCLAVAVRYPAAFIATHWPDAATTFQAALDGSITTAIVFNVDRREMQGTNFCYKSCGETGGPYAAVSPSILKLLSPIIGISNSAKWAQEWRGRCAAGAAKRKEQRAAIAKISDGCRIKLLAPVTFQSGVVADEFIAVHGRWRKRGRTVEGLAFRDVVSGGLFSLRPAELASATVIN